MTPTVLELIVTVLILSVSFSLICSLIVREIRAHRYDREGMKRRDFPRPSSEAFRQDRERYVISALQHVNNYLAKKERSKK